MGCYSFTNHVIAHHPGTLLGFDVPTVRDALTARLGDVAYIEGRTVEGTDASGIAAAVDAARAAGVAIVVVGDRADGFGRGTVGEGNDADSLELPGLQRQLVEAIVDTGTPVVLVLLIGRPCTRSTGLSTPPSVPRRCYRPPSPGRRVGRLWRRSWPETRLRPDVFPSRCRGPQVLSRIPTCTRYSVETPE
jgi:hypothetical protein